MPENPLRRLLSRIKCGEDPARVEVAYIHRGAPQDMAIINASKIVHVGKGSFLLSDGETRIPFHRILYVKDRKRELVLWEKRKPEQASVRDP